MNNKTTFIRQPKKEKFTTISNELIQSDMLTSAEKDILFYLLSLPDDWIIYKQNIQLKYHKTLKKKKFDNAWSGLKDKGYITSQRIKGENGKFSSWSYIVREIPISDLSEMGMSVIGEVDKSTYPKSDHIQSTYLQNTNIESTNSINTNLINRKFGIEEKKINKNSKINNKKSWSKKEIELDIFVTGMDKIFSGSEKNWINEINSNPKEEFISKFSSQLNCNREYLEYMYSEYEKIYKDSSSTQSGLIEN